MGKAEDLLAAKLEEAEARIAELEEDNERIRTWLPWTEHEFLDGEEQPDLPVPRLELLWEEGRFERGYRWQCKYRLVYRHYTEGLMAVPLGITSVGNMDKPNRYGRLEVPIRDGAYVVHDAKQLNLPAFVRYGDQIESVEPRGK